MWTCEEGLLMVTQLRSLPVERRLWIKDLSQNVESS